MTNEITIRQVRQPDLDTFQQRIVQIFLDAFTTQGFSFYELSVTKRYFHQSLDTHGPKGN